MQIFGLHVDSTSELHQASTNSKFRFSLGLLARAENIIKAQNGSMFTSHIDSISKQQRKIHVESSTDILSILKFESTSSYSRRINTIISTWTAFHNRWNIDRLSIWDFDVESMANQRSCVRWDTV